MSIKAIILSFLPEAKVRLENCTYTTHHSELAGPSIHAFLSEIKRKSRLEIASRNAVLLVLFMAKVNTFLYSFCTFYQVDLFTVASVLWQPGSEGWKLRKWF